MQIVLFSFGGKPKPVGQIKPQGKHIRNIVVKRKLKKKDEVILLDSDSEVDILFSSQILYVPVQRTMMLTCLKNGTSLLTK